MRKNWNFDSFRQATILDACETLLKPLGESALVMAENGNALHVHAQSPIDYATLPVAARTCSQYLRLADGEVAICNDPQSGGTRLTDLTLIMGCAIESSAQTPELLLAARVSLPPLFSVTQRLDDEGLRIPPMPLTQRGKLNRDMLSAMAAHPLAPKDLPALLENTIHTMNRVAETIKRMGHDSGSDFRVANFKSYLEDSRKAFAYFLGKLALGEAQVTRELERGEIIKLKVETHDERIHFDFVGTESSTFLQLPEMTTFGACFAATQLALNTLVPANSGTFAALEVRTPENSLVNAKGAAATALGTLDGFAIIADLAAQALSILNPPLRAANSGLSLCPLNLKFADGAVLSWITHGGRGATAERAGIDSHNIWVPDLNPLSLENSEAKFPLRWQSVTGDAGSGGTGKFRGGHAASYTLELLKDAEFTWAGEESALRPSGMNGGKAGNPAEITVQHSSSGKEKLPPSGLRKLAAGTVIRVVAAGGGGAGASATPAEEEPL